MKTDLNALMYSTLSEVQTMLNVNDPGYTAVFENNKIVVRDNSGVVVAEVDQYGQSVKTLLSERL